MSEIDFNYSNIQPNRVNTKFISTALRVTPFLSKKYVDDTEIQYYCIKSCGLSFENASHSERGEVMCVKTNKNLNSREKKSHSIRYSNRVKHIL